MALTSHSDRHCRHANHEIDTSLTTNCTPGLKIGQPRSAKEKKAINQQYLTPQEEKALVAYLLRWAGDGRPWPVKAVRLLALVIRRHRTSRFQRKTVSPLLLRASPGSLDKQGT
jgi:hypothetical protein